MLVYNNSFSNIIEESTSSKSNNCSHLIQKVANATLKNPLFWAFTFAIFAITFTALPLFGIISIPLSIVIPVSSGSGLISTLFFIFICSKRERQQPIQQQWKISKPPLLDLPRQQINEIDDFSDEEEEIKEIKGVAAEEVKEKKATNAIPQVVEIKQKNAVEEEIKEIKVKKSEERIGSTQISQANFVEIMGITTVFSNLQEQESKDLDSNDLIIVCNALGSVHLLSAKFSDLSLEGAPVALMAESFYQFLISEPFRKEFRIDRFNKLIINAFKNLRDIDLMSLNSIENSTHYAQKICSLIRSLKIGEAITIPAGWKGKPGHSSHCFYYVICRTSYEHCSMAIVNTGDGLTYHPSCYTTSKESEKLKYSPVIIHPSIKQDNLDNIELWKAHYELLYTKTNVDEDWRNAEFIYETWLDAITPAFLQKAIHYTTSLNIEYITPQPAGYCSLDALFAVLHLISPTKSYKKRIKLAYKFNVIEKHLFPLMEKYKKTVQALKSGDLKKTVSNIKAHLDLFDILLRDFIRSVNKARSDKFISIELTEKYSIRIEEFLNYNLETDKLLTNLIKNTKIDFSKLQQGKFLTIVVPNKETVETPKTTTTNKVNENFTVFRVDCTIPNNIDTLLSKTQLWNKQLFELMSGKNFQRLEAHFFLRDILTGITTKPNSFWEVDKKMAAALMEELDSLQISFYRSLKYLPKNTNIRVETLVLMQKLMLIMWKLFSICEDENNQYTLHRNLYTISKNKSFIFSQNPKLNLIDPDHQVNKDSLFGEYAFPENSLSNYDKLHVIESDKKRHDFSTVDFVNQYLKSNQKRFNEIREKISKDTLFLQATSNCSIVTDHCVLAWCLAYPDKYLPKSFCQIHRAIITFTSTKLLDSNKVDESILLNLQLKGLNSYSKDQETTLTIDHYLPNQEYLNNSGYMIQLSESSLTKNLFEKLTLSESQNETMITNSNSSKSYNEFGRKLISEYQLIRSSDDNLTHQLRNAIAFFTKYRSKLLKIDFHILFETVFFEKNYLMDTLKIDIRFGDLLSKFILDSYQFTLSQLEKNKISSTLFILRMGSYFKQYAPLSQFPDIISYTDSILKECSHFLSERDLILIQRERLAYLGRLDNGVTADNYGKLLMELMQYREKAYDIKYFNHQKLNDDIHQLHHKILQIIKDQNEKELSSQLGFRCILEYPYIRSVNSAGEKTDRIEINLQEPCMFVDGTSTTRLLPYRFIESVRWQRKFHSTTENIKNIRSQRINDTTVFYTFIDQAGYTVQFYDRNNDNFDVERIINGKTYLHVPLDIPLPYGEFWQRKDYSDGLVIDRDGKIRCVYREITSLNGQKSFSLCSLEGDSKNLEFCCNSNIDFDANSQSIESIFHSFHEQIFFWMKSPEDQRIVLIEFSKLDLKFKVVWDGDKLVRIEGLPPYHNYVLAENQLLPELFRFQHSLVLMEKQTKAKKILIRYLSNDDNNLANWDSDFSFQKYESFYESDLNNREVCFRLAYLHLLHRNYELSLKILKEQSYSPNAHTTEEDRFLNEIIHCKSQNNPSVFALQLRAHLLKIHDKINHRISHLTSDINPHLVNNYFKNLSHIPDHFRLTPDEEALVIKYTYSKERLTLHRMVKEAVNNKMIMQTKWSVEILQYYLKNIIYVEENFIYSDLSLSKATDWSYLQRKFFAILNEIRSEWSDKKRIRTFLKLNTNQILAEFLIQIIDDPAHFNITKESEINDQYLQNLAKKFKPSASYSLTIPVFFDPFPIKNRVTPTPISRIQYDTKLAASKLDSNVQNAIVACPEGLISQREKKAERESELFASLERLQKLCRNRVEARSFKDFQEEINEYIKQPKFEYLGDKAGLRNYLKQLIAEKRKYLTSEKDIREKILKLANKESGDRELRLLTKNRILGKSLNPLKIGDLLKVFISDDNLSNDLIRQYQNLNRFLTMEECFSVHQKLKDYLILKTYKQKLNRICVAIKRYLTHSSKIDESEYLNEIFKTISSVRQYDPDLLPKYLVCETTRDILLRKSQVDNLKLFNNENNSVALQMGMGEGKTVVMLPFIAMMQAQQGKKLSVLMFPDELINSAIYVLQNTCRILNCRLNRINWFDFSQENLENTVERLHKIKDERGILVVTTSEIHQFNIALWDAMLSNSSKLQFFLYIKNILSNSIVTKDELHICCPTDRDVRQSVGTYVTLKEDKYQLSVYLFELLVTHPEIVKRFSFNFYVNQQKGTGIPFSFELDQDTKRIIIEHALKWVVGKYPKWTKILNDHYKEIFNLFIPKFGEWTGFQSLDSDLKELLGLIKGQLKTLEFTLKRNHNEHFGLFQEKDQNNDEIFTAIAGPFKSAGTPNYGSQFADTIEQINLTIQSFYASPKAIPQFLWKEIQRMKESAKIEMAFGKPLEETSGYREFIELIQFTKNGLKATELIVLQEFQISHLSLDLWKSIAALNHFLAKYILPNIKLYPHVLISDAWQLLSRFGKVNGCTGTPTDHLQAQFSTVVKEKGSNGKVICLLAEDSIGNEIRIKDGTEPKQILKQLIKQENSKHLALIDAGALFKEVLMQEAAELILKERADLTGVVFYHNDEEMVLLRGKKEPVKTCGVDYTTNKDVFLLLGQRQCTGIDKQLPITAQAWITTNPQVTYTNFSQAAMRLRKLGAGQTLQCVAMESTFAIAGQALGKSNVNAVDLALLAKLQEINKLSRSNLNCLIQGIRNVVIQAIETAIEKNRNDYSDLAGLLITHYNTSFWDQHHPIEILVKDREAIESIIEKYLMPLRKSHYHSLFSFKMLTEQMWVVAERFLTKNLINEQVKVVEQEHLEKAVAVTTQAQTSHNQNNRTNNNIENNLQQEIESKLSKSELEVSRMPKIEIDHFEREGYFALKLQCSELLKGKHLEFSLQNQSNLHKTIPILPIETVLEIGGIKTKNQPISFSESLYCSVDFAFTCHLSYSNNLNNVDISETAPFGYYQKPPGPCLLIRNKENEKDFRFIMISGEEADRIEIDLRKRREQLFKMYDITLYDPRINYFYPGDSNYDSLQKNVEFQRCYVQYRILAGLYIPKPFEKIAIEWVRSHTAKDFEEFYLRLIKFDGNLRSNYKFSQMKNWVKVSSV